MRFSLRPYQTDAKNSVRDLFSQDKKRVILCKPTGSGKTVTFANIVRESVINGFKAMIIVDRSELLNQSREKLIDYGLNPSLITSGKTSKINSDTYIATVQTLARRTSPEVDLIIIDEAHKQIFDKILDRPEYKNTFVIGATATPFRSGKMNQLEKYYDEIVETVTIKDLIAQGFLSPAITFGANIDRSQIKTKGQDFDSDAMFNAFNKSTLYKGVVKHYKKFANNTKAIVFNVNVEHSKKVTQAFLNEGIKAVHLDGKTNKSERKRILEAFKFGQIKILCNVDILTTGFDEWTIETVIVNRATKSLPLWLQMAGRGSRITPKEYKGNPKYLQKDFFNLIDMGGNVFSLGFWEEDRGFSLRHKTSNIEKVAPVKTCPEDQTDENNKSGCGAILHASAKSCKYCGYKFPKAERVEEEAEFIQIDNYDTLPEDLVGKAWGSLSFEELERVKTAKKFKFGWIVKQIIMREDLSLEDYAKFKDYKDPIAWSFKMRKMYLKK